MTAPQFPTFGPKRSQRGLPGGSAGSPRRALVPDDSEPILSGYTYQPSEVTPPTLDPSAFTPLAPTPPLPDSIEKYAPKRHLGWWVAGVLVLVAAIVSGIVLNSLPRPTPDTPTATTSSPPAPTASRSGGVAFVDSVSGVSGYWRITNPVWQATSVQLTVEIIVDKGSLFYDFYAWANTDGNELEPVANSAIDLRSGWVNAGETITGTLTFEVARQPITVILASTGGSQLSGLQVDP